MKFQWGRSSLIPILVGNSGDIWHFHKSCYVFTSLKKWKQRLKTVQQSSIYVYERFMLMFYWRRKIVNHLLYNLFKMTSVIKQIHPQSCLTSTRETKLWSRRMGVKKNEARLFPLEYDTHIREALWMGFSYHAWLCGVIMIFYESTLMYFQQSRKGDVKFSNFWAQGLIF